MPHGIVSFHIYAQIRFLLVLSSYFIGRSTGNGLKGTIPSELSAIDTLDGLQIENNQISGTIPSELALLPSFTKLIAGNNLLGNPIPEEVINKGILQILLLERNDFDGPIPDLSGMRNLEMLFLHQNSFTGAIPTFFGSLQNLGECIYFFAVVLVFGNSSIYRWYVFIYAPRDPIKSDSLFLFSFWLISI